MSTVVFGLSLGEVADRRISICEHATPGRLRLVDCLAIINERMLKIYEFEEFPSVLYADISYVWKGNPLSTLYSHADEDAGYFNVEGAEDSDPISIDVLRYACIASLEYSLGQVGYLWLDRLCILQTSREDKTWQITQMFEVYKCCDVAIVLPNGLQQLVPLDQETAWVHRAWTLQEAPAPPAARVLHLWEWEEGQVSTGITDEWVGAVEVVPGRCALTDLDNVVEACTLGELRWAPCPADEPENVGEWRTTPARILGTGTQNLHAFLDALRSTNLEELGDFRDYAVWKSALTRTSSRPVDMVFSIMGLFGVTLDPKAYAVNDRLGATIALAREILSRGGTAAWVSVATHVPPSRHISTFPEFPETSIAGKAVIKASGLAIDAATSVDEDCMNARATGVKAGVIMGEIDQVA